MHNVMFFTLRFKPDDHIALVLLSASSTIQKIMKVSDAISERTLSWISYMNLQGYNVYSSASRLNENAKSRTKGEFHCLQRTLWVELDFAPLEGMREWENKLPELPLPNLVVSSSPGKFHIYWVLKDYIHRDRVETLNKAIADYFRAKYPNKNIDSVHDVSRVLRIPGFKNWKNRYYTRLHWVREKPIFTDAFCDALRIAKQSPPCDFPLSTVEQADNVYNHTGGRLRLPKNNTPYKSQSEGDISEVIYFLANGKTSEKCIEYLKKKRADEKRDVDYYARLTVAKAKEYLEKTR